MTIVSEELVEEPLEGSEYFIALDELSNEDEIESPIKDLVRERSDFAAKKTVRAFYDNDIDLAVYFGTMAGGKSTAFKQTVQMTREIYGVEDANLPENKKRKVHVFSADDRKEGAITIREDDDGLDGVFISNISEIKERIDMRTIRSGDMIAVNELQFISNDDQAIEFAQVCQENGIKLVVDCLGAWFNTKPVSQISSLLESIDNERIMSFCFQGFDSYSKDKFAEMSARGVGVRVDLKTGKIFNEIVHFHENGNGREYDATYYLSNPDLNVARIAGDIFKRFGKSVLVTEDVKLGMNVPHILIPSHPNDSPIAVGLKRYQPTSLETYIEMCEIAGIDLDDSDILPITKVYNHPSIVRWPNRLELAA